MNRLRYLLARTAFTAVLIGLVVTFLFFLFRLLPGSFLDLMTVRGVSPESVAAMEEQWGLNDPLHVQYFTYVENLLRGDLGNSIRYRQDVWVLVQTRLLHTFILVAPGITIAYILGSIYGTIAGSDRGSSLEKYGSLLIIFVGSFPSFVLSIFLIIIFASWLNWFPTGGLMDTLLYNELKEIAWWRPYLTEDFLWHYTLPFAAIVLRYMYFPSLLMRTSVIDVANQPFMFYHRITGLPKFRYYRHLAKNASLPVITMYPVSLTQSIGGLVLIETVFNWPGVGNLLVDAVLGRDYPVMMFLFFLIAAFVIIANYVVDVAYSFIDPRLEES